MTIIPLILPVISGFLSVLLSLLGAIGASRRLSQIQRSADELSRIRSVPGVVTALAGVRVRIVSLRGAIMTALLTVRVSIVVRSIGGQTTGVTVREIRSDVSAAGVAGRAPVFLVTSRFVTSAGIGDVTRARIVHATRALGELILRQAGPIPARDLLRALRLVDVMLAHVHVVQALIVTGTSGNWDLRVTWK